MGPGATRGHGHRQPRRAGLRYGLVHVDHQTKRRTVKASGHWYQTVATANGPPST
ncbi:family 1 glycosylhydrolase [Nonomuraea sp. NPDC059023]|uniref:family 1 glycosylhydrolase n=1 Tax=unclassified Nonomuraea TaxID=2593643 RepID=UPI0036B85646